MHRCHVCRAVVRDDLDLCRNCATAIRGKLEQVPLLIEAARADLALQQRRADRGPIGKTSEHGLPLARPAVIRAVQHADDVLDGIVARVASVNRIPVDLNAVIRTRTVQPSWPANAASYEVPVTHLDEVYELRGQRDPAGRAVVPTQAEAAAVWLMNHLPALRRHPEPGCMHDEITDAVETLKDAVDLPRARKFRGPCRNCDRDLYAYDGETKVTCDVRRGGCGAIFDASDLAKFLIEQARPVLMTAEKARAAIRDWTELELPAATIRSWHNRGQLVAVAWEHKGRPAPVWIHRNDPPLFRFGDILDLLTKPRHRKDPR